MPSDRLAHHSLHPYTRALRSAVPEIDPDKRRLRVLLRGELPSPLSPPEGCAFHPRCAIAERGLCDVTRPELRELATGHWAACHLAQA
jgi:oligopeptide/dipeptide ABC transporter ATP-binding protein